MEVLAVIFFNSLCNYLSVYQFISSNLVYQHTSFCEDLWYSISLGTFGIYLEKGAFSWEGMYNFKTNSSSKLVTHFEKGEKCMGKKKEIMVSTRKDSVEQIQAWSGGSFE